MDDTEKLALSNAIISLLLILSEIIGWSACKSNSLTEIIVNLLQSNKCVGRSNVEEEL